MNTEHSTARFRPASGHEDFLRELLRLLNDLAPPSEFEALLARTELSALPSATQERLQEDAGAALRIGDLLRQHRRRESELLALYETAQDLTALRDPDRVLQAIVRRARQLIGSDVAYLSVYDQDRDDFYVRATEGTYSEAFGRIRVPRGIGICDFVGRTRRPYFSSGYLEDERFSHSTSIDAAIRSEELVSLLGVPLQAAGRVLGVLFVANRFARSFSQHEVALLSSLAAHAALAIENARMFEDTQSALRRVSEANELLEARAVEVERAATVHERLTALIARGGSLKDLAEMVSEALVGRVTIVDEGLHPICEADAEAVSEETVEPASADLDEPVRLALLASKKTGRSVSLSNERGGECRVAAMVGSSRLLGGLILRTVRPLPDVDVRTFERGAMVTAAMLLSQERILEAENRDAADVVTGLLKEPQEDTERLRREAIRRGLDPTKRAAVLLIDVASGRTGYALQLIRRFLSEEGKGLAGEYNGDLVILVSSAKPEAVATRIRGLLSTSLGEPVTIAASKCVSRPSELPSAYRAARRCSMLLKALGRSGTVGTEAELSVYSLLFAEHGRLEVDAYLRETLGPLLDHDDRRHTELARTLLVYLDNGRSARKAARELHVHVNTVRQRLELVTRILGRWEDPARALEVHLALRLHQLHRQTRHLH